MVIGSRMCGNIKSSFVTSVLKKMLSETRSGGKMLLINYRREYN